MKIEVRSEEAKVIERKFCDHFTNIFTITNPSRQQREVALRKCQG